MSGERVEFRQCGALPVSIAGQPPRPLPIHEFDLNRLLPPGLPPLDGLLALDALADQPFTLDLAHDTLTLETASSLRQRSARGVEVAVRAATGVDGSSLTLFVNAVTGDGQSLWLELDSGNLAPVQLAKRPQSSPVAPGAAVAGLELILGALHTEPLEYEVRDLIHDGALNARFLERHALTVDIRRGRAWLER